MGCGGSKATNEKIALTDDDRKAINDIADAILKSSVQFQNTIQTIQPLGIHTNPPHMINDPREVRTFFKAGQLPTQLGEGKYSIIKMVETMRLAAQQESAKVLVQRLQEQKKDVDDGVKARYQNIVNTEADRAMAAAVEGYVKSVFDGTTGAASGAAAPIAPQQRSQANPNAQQQQEGGVTRQPSLPPRSVSPGQGAAPQVVLPAGRWVLAEGSPFYWSDEERLFYHPDSAQFFDPETNKWFDPERQEWYDEDEQ